ncbi:MAG: hypothetical protein O3A08_09815, partial [Proteobacteria bacterium]|nr:hypothetical protein [Pseudomonadota bacterium]
GAFAAMASALRRTVRMVFLTAVYPLHRLYRSAVFFIEVEQTLDDDLELAKSPIPSLCSLTTLTRSRHWREMQFFTPTKG